MAQRTCIEDGCERPGRGPRCTMHYQRFRNAGGVSAPRGSKAICGAPDCSRSLSRGGLGYCSMHYQRVKNTGKLTTDQPHRPHRPRTGRCTIEGCDLPDRSQGLCNAHYCRWRAHGDPEYTKRAAHSHRYGVRDSQKRCTRCEQRKPVGDFFRNKGSKDGYLTLCKDCSMGAERVRRQENPASYRERRRAYYEANAEAQCASTRRWYQDNLERAREYSRLYHQKNRDRKREYDRTRREARAEQGRAWRTPERSRAYANRRRARKLNAPQGDQQLRMEYDRIIMLDPCVYCGAPAEHADHILPLVRGGSDAWDNLAPSCASCNFRKHDRDLLTFLMVREQPSRRAARGTKQAS